MFYWPFSCTPGCTCTCMSTQGSSLYAQQLTLLRTLCMGHSCTGSGGSQSLRLSGTMSLAVCTACLRLGAIGRACWLCSAQAQSRNGKAWSQPCPTCTWRTMTLRGRCLLICPPCCRTLMPLATRVSLGAAACLLTSVLALHVSSILCISRDRMPKGWKHLHERMASATCICMHCRNCTCSAAASSSKVTSLGYLPEVMGMHVFMLARC